MGYEKDSGEKESTTIQEKSWQDSSGNDSGTTNNPNNNGGFTDNSQSAKEALQLQKMAESSSEYIQLKKWADNIGGGGDPTPNDNPIQKKENKTGLPDKLKAGMENNSGMPLDDVKVHRNSEKPAQLQAHAYAQGTDIHLGPGQEKHLPHELGHVVQQKQGIVKPTTQQNGAAINDDKGLEKNADTLGAKALQPTAQLKAKDTGSNNSISNLSQVIQQWQMEDKEKMNNTSIQRKVVQRNEDDDTQDAASETREDEELVCEGSEEGNYSESPQQSDTEGTEESPYVMEEMYLFSYNGETYAMFENEYQSFVDSKISELNRAEILQMRLSVGATRSIWNHFKEINDDQYIVSWLVELTRGADLPAESFITNAEAAFNSVESALNSRSLSQITNSIESAEPIINNAIDTMSNYRDTMIEGAGNWIRGLGVTSTTSFAIAAVAGGAVLGPVMVSYAGGSTVIGGVYTGAIMGGGTGLVSSSANELGEAIAGTQDDEWLSDILYNTVRGMATGAVTGAIIGKLTPYMQSLSGNLASRVLPDIASRVVSEVAEEALAAAIELSLKGSANRFFMTCIQQAWDEIAYAIAGGDEAPTMERFIDKLVQTTLAGGLVPVLLASGPILSAFGPITAGAVAGMTNDSEE